MSARLPVERASILAAAGERKQGWEKGSERACEEGGGGAQTTGDRVCPRSDKLTARRVERQSRSASSRCNRI